jgi:hypothetical protein
MARQHTHHGKRPRRGRLPGARASGEQEPERDLRSRRRKAEKATARYLFEHRPGARRSERPEALAKRIERAAGTALPVTCDVADPDQVEALVMRACERFGRVDVMGNNAGVATDAGPSPERLPHGLFQKILQVNLLGVRHGCRPAGARMPGDGLGGRSSTSRHGGPGRLLAGRPRLPGLEGGRHRAHAGPGVELGRPRSARQTRSPSATSRARWPTRSSPSRRSCSACSTRSRWAAGWAIRASWPGRSCFWPPTPRAT